LKALRCDYVQGFHDARPMPADEIPGWLAEHALSR
jgi:EAL domain-containing protein (putative c-di-GMP-specific phosphodiesterase class I)